MNKDLIKIYEKSVEDNINYLIQLEKDVFRETKLSKDFHQILVKSSGNLTEKWQNEKKHLRTEYCISAIPNYPKDIIMPSIHIDAAINLMDDILDENLSKNEMMFCLIECVRVLSIKNKFCLTDKMRTSISKCFNKLIFLSITEFKIIPQISKEKDISALFDIIRKFYFARTFDIDIFVELPLLKMNIQQDEIDEAVNIGRKFRVINILKKDFFDLSHDKKCNIPSVITILEKKKIPLKKVIDFLYADFFDGIPKSKSPYIQKIIKNFVGLAEKEIDVLEKTIKK